ncbi:hypothetical protein DL96DRAFT_1825902 [Flagelloscypha sp. PMI_526]|nr:hypothetical protein DL96DRAFT_1825902 [Flagelloscypha sp. PMI_526]
MPRKPRKIESQAFQAAELPGSRVVLAVTDFEPLPDEGTADRYPRKPLKTANGPSAAEKGNLVKAASFDPKWRHTKGRRGLLKKFVNHAPLDILFEIFAHLGLPDLHALTQSSKDLRGLLLSKASPGTEALWKHAREAVVGLPDKPDNMSEPQFASLMFGKTCMKCEANGPFKFMYRRRLCKRCFKDDTVKFSSVQKFIRTLIPEDSVDFPSSYSECIPLYSRHPARRFVDLMYSKDDIRNFLFAYRNQPQDSRVRWLIEQANTVEDKITLTTSCEAWMFEQNKNKRNRLDDLRAQRYEQVIARLRDLGWGQDLDAMEDYELCEFQNLKSIKKPQALTDRMWENMSSEIVGFMQNFRNRSRQRWTVENRDSRLQILARARARYRHNIGLDKLVPQIGYLAALPQFSAILEFDILQAAFPEDSFDHLFAHHFASVCDTWLIKTQEFLFATCSDGTRDPKELLLAKNELLCVESCRESQGSTRYPTALYHCCTSGRDSSFSSDVENSLSIAVGQPPLRLQTSKTAEHFIRLCGLDPATTTYEEIMRLNPLFFCRPCSSTGHATTPTRYVFNYPHALEHQHIVWTQPISRDDYVFINDEIQTCLQGISTLQGPVSLYGWSRRSSICCCHCPVTLFDRRREILEHMLEMFAQLLPRDATVIQFTLHSHDILEPVRGVDYKLDHEQPCVKWDGWGRQLPIRPEAAAVLEL